MFWHAGQPERTAGQQKGKVRSSWGSCLLLLHLTATPPPPPAGNKQSFSTDRYMLNHCYLCSQTNQIMDYSSLELTLSLSSIFAKVSQFHTFHTCVCMWGRFRFQQQREYQLTRANVSDGRTISLRGATSETEKNTTANKEKSLLKPSSNIWGAFLLVKSSNLEVSGEL